MKKMLFSAALAMLITGCAQQTFTVGNKPTAVTPKETITHHFFVSGIGQKKTVDAAKICGGAENVVKTETQQTFVNGLLGFITSEGEIIPFSGVCQSGGGCIIHAGGGGGFTH
ncbi:Bor/Iss family lipoprotein [Escherichia coli]|uniref:Bor family protein n=1 Tax=Escherichia coli TaxID=562 RepID=UPI003F5186C0